MKSAAIGIITAIATFAVVIYGIETHSSAYQVFIGFILFIFPIMFLSSFRAALPALVLALLVLTTGYCIWKFQYFDIIQGILLAAILGGTTFYFRVRKTKTFSPSEFKRDASRET